MAHKEHEVNDLYVPVTKEFDTMEDVGVYFSCLNQRENIYDFDPFSDSGYKNMGEYEEEVVEDKEDGQQEEEEDKKQEEETYEDDGDYIVDSEALVDDWDVDMREVNSVVDEVEWFGQAPETKVDLNQDGHELELINNNEFESVGFKEDSRKKMLRNLKKKVPCSYGVVHDRTFYVGQSFKTKKDVQG
ncbi:hypothetical protein Lser_V15G29192 [Lactuca serriola]